MKDNNYSYFKIVKSKNINDEIDQIKKPVQIKIKVWKLKWKLRFLISIIVVISTEKWNQTK